MCTSLYSYVLLLEVEVDFGRIVSHSFIYIFKNEGNFSTHKYTHLELEINKFI